MPAVEKIVVSQFDGLRGAAVTSSPFWPGLFSIDSPKTREPHPPLYVEMLFVRFYLKSKRLTDDVTALFVTYHIFFLFRHPQTRAASNAVKEHGRPKWVA